MRPSDFDTTMQDLHKRPTRPAANTDQLADELISRHRGLFEPRPRSLMNLVANPQFLVLAFVALFGIGACTVPTETTVTMGHRLTFSVTPSQIPNDQAGKTARLLEISDQMESAVAFAETFAGVESIIEMIRVASGQSATLDLVVWGEGIDRSLMLQSIVERWPVLANAAVEAEELTGTFNSSFARKIGHDLFLIGDLGGSPEEMRDEILQSIYASGFAGEANVQVHRDSTGTDVDVEMKKDTDGAQYEKKLRIETDAKTE